MTAIQLIGQTVTTTRVNLRQGAASTAAPVLRIVEAGTPIPVLALVAGQAVQGNAHWYLTNENAYIWAGGCAPFVPAPAPASSQSGSVPNVVDIYHGDTVTDFAQARAAGVIGVIHKATTGQSGHDTMYAARRGAAKAAGLLWGAYHWGTAAPVDKQVANFLKVAAPDDDTLVALDFETTAGDQMTLDQARAFLQAIEDKLGRRAVLYSGNVIKEALGNTVDEFFSGHRLWLSQYCAPGERPTVQASWSTFWLWQYTEGKPPAGLVKVPGIPGNSAGQVDCNHFVGSEALLRQQWAS